MIGYCFHFYFILYRQAFFWLNSTQPNNYGAMIWNDYLTIMQWILKNHEFFLKLLLNDHGYGARSMDQLWRRRKRVCSQASSLAQRTPLRLFWKPCYMGYPQLCFVVCMAGPTVICKVGGRTGLRLEMKLHWNYSKKIPSCCSLRLQRWGPTGPTVGPFGPSQKKMSEIFVWIFFSWNFFPEFFFPKFFWKFIFLDIFFVKLFSGIFFSLHCWTKFSVTS